MLSLVTVHLVNSFPVPHPHWMLVPRPRPSAAFHHHAHLFLGQHSSPPGHHLLVVITQDKSCTRRFSPFLLVGGSEGALRVGSLGILCGVTCLVVFLCPPTRSPWTPLCFLFALLDPSAALLLDWCHARNLRIHLVKHCSQTKVRVWTLPLRLLCLT